MSNYFYIGNLISKDKLYDYEIYTIRLKISINHLFIKKGYGIKEIYINNRNKCFVS